MHASRALFDDVLFNWLNYMVLLTESRYRGDSIARHCNRKADIGLGIGRSAQPHFLKLNPTISIADPTIGGTDPTIPLFILL